MKHVRSSTLWCTYMFIYFFNFSPIFKRIIIFRCYVYLAGCLFLSSKKAIAIFFCISRYYMLQRVAEDRTDSLWHLPPIHKILIPLSSKYVALFWPILSRRYWFSLKTCAIITLRQRGWGLRFQIFCCLERKGEEKKKKKRKGVHPCLWGLYQVWTNSNHDLLLLLQGFPWYVFYIFA